MTAKFYVKVLNIFRVLNSSTMKGAASEKLR